MHSAVDSADTHNTGLGLLPLQIMKGQKLWDQKIPYIYCFQDSFKFCHDLFLFFFLILILIFILHFYLKLNG